MPAVAHYRGRRLNNRAENFHQPTRERVLPRDGGEHVMARVLAPVPESSLDAVLMAVELVLESQAISAEHVLNVLTGLIPSPRIDSVETARASGQHRPS
jgi:hypothetical protein